MHCDCPAVEEQYLTPEVVLLSAWLRGREAAVEFAPGTGEGLSRTRERLVRLHSVIASCRGGISVRPVQTHFDHDSCPGTELDAPRPSFLRRPTSPVWRVHEGCPLQPSVSNKLMSVTE